MQPGQRFPFPKLETAGNAPLASKSLPPPHLHCPPIDLETYQWLEQRVGRCHLNQRLGIEHDFEARVFGQGRTLFHIENWYSVHGLMRYLLRLLWLHSRGRENARTIEIRHNEIVLERLPRAFDGFTLLHLTDLHLDIEEDIPQALIDAVNRVDGYDICVLTGDFRAKTFGPYEPALTAMQRVRPFLKEPVYGVLGNHDTIRMAPRLENLGIRMLLNESTPLTRGDATIYLAGIDDPHYYRADNLEKATDQIPEGSFSILLSHSPETYRHAAYASFDVMLSGHTHGGQICLPGRIPIMLNAKAPRAFCNGPWRYHSLQGYTSAGSGVSIVDVRLNCPPEITLHRLRCA
ncbi:metallophosphoesterase [Methylocaldum sp.]|uniref:metallophosphoesterase n=1 Tax=Methylocaldum sp. TaxID=1969727 RepID=UPI002D70A0B9|nr:metallophosphoesterase [Methylocaldum sp.]HYE35142.1 metallophosphoesterase [Methylocaldum sp.]